ncbi:hypothetical protein NM688_g4326 [Phlebia brevispora]|uniref:Uncharacterized protein n=1 Tax=Phlebia brevispora TaxID=194682 RepID=A0ACC1T3U4_9APHY|nr:hypothetical protein NM688_g4326 [Phlebia brevispora]
MGTTMPHSPTKTSSIAAHFRPVRPQATGHVTNGRSRRSLACDSCASLFHDSIAAETHWRIAHQQSARVTVKDIVGCNKQVLRAWKRRGGGFACNSCKHVFEDPADWKEHVRPCVAACSAQPVAASSNNSNKAGRVTVGENDLPQLLPARNAYKATTRATRAMIRNLHKRGHHVNDIANNLNLSPVAVFDSIQNKSEDDVASDDKYIEDCTILSEEALEELLRVPESDLPHVEVHFKLDPAEETGSMEGEDTMCLSPAPSHAVPSTEGDDDRGDDAAMDIDLDVPQDAHADVQMASPEADTPCTDLSVHLLIASDRTDEMEVEQLLIDHISPKAIGASSGPSLSDDLANLGELEYPTSEEEIGNDARNTGLSSNGSQPYSERSKGLSHTEHMRPLVDIVEKFLSSLGVDVTVVAPAFKKLGCKSESDFDALNQMASRNGWFIFQTWLKEEVNSLTPTQLSVIGAGLRKRKPAYRVPWSMRPISRSSSTVMLDFLQSLRRPLVHHLSIFHNHGITEVDDLENLCSQQDGCGLEIARYVFLRAGFNLLDWIILREGLQLASLQVSAGGLAAPSLDDKQIQLGQPYVHTRSHPTVEAPQRNSHGLQLTRLRHEGSLPHQATRLFPISPQIDKPATRRLDESLEERRGLPESRSRFLVNFLSELYPSQRHHFALVYDSGFRNVDHLLELASDPDSWDDVGEHFMKEGMSILEWVGMIRGLKHLSTHGIGDARLDRDNLLKTLKDLSPGLVLLTDVLWSLGIRAGHDLHIVARFEQHWGTLRAQLLLKGVTFTDWLGLKQALHSLNPKVTCRVLDGGTRAFLGELRKPLDGHATLFTTIGLDSVDELDALCNCSAHWNSVIIMLLDTGRLTLMEGLALRDGFERRAYCLL